MNKNAFEVACVDKDTLFHHRVLTYMHIQDAWKVAMRLNRNNTNADVYYTVRKFAYEGEHSMNLVEEISKARIAAENEKDPWGVWYDLSDAARETLSEYDSDDLLTIMDAWLDENGDRSYTDIYRLEFYTVDEDGEQEDYPELTVQVFDEHTAESMRKQLLTVYETLFMRSGPDNINCHIEHIQEGERA